MIFHRQCVDPPVLKTFLHISVKFLTTLTVLCGLWVRIDLLFII